MGFNASSLFFFDKEVVVMRLERDFQPKVIKRLKEEFPNSIVMKLDPTYIQGIPDLLILYQDKWACLETKRCATASRRPNQEFYVKELDGMSFARFVSPENLEEVIYELQQTFCD